MLKSQTVAEKTAKKIRGPLFSAAPCSISRQNFMPLGDGSLHKRGEERGALP